MKHTLFLFIVCLYCAACSSIMPYKDQNLDYLYSIQKDPAAYKGAVVAFNGEVAGIRETPKSIRLVLRIDTPLYYYATGKGNSLSYEMLYVLFTKNKSQTSKIAKGNKLKVLGRVDGYITRQDGYGNTAGVVRLRAIALADRSQDKDFYLSDAPSAALYTSWKKGKQMSDKPDLVLTGKFIEKDGSFIFSEGSYRYLVVPDTYKYMLKVQHNGKTILQQPQEAEE